MEWLKDVNPQRVVLVLSVVVWGLTWLTKTKAGLGIFEKLSPAWRRIIPVIFAALAAALYELETGTGLMGALEVAIGSVSLAVFGQEFVLKGALRFLTKPGSVTINVAGAHLSRTGMRARPSKRHYG